MTRVRPAASLGSRSRQHGYVSHEMFTVSQMEIDTLESVQRGYVGVWPVMT